MLLLLLLLLAWPWGNYCVLGGHGRATAAGREVWREVINLLTVRVEPRAGFVSRGDARGHGPWKKRPRND